MVSEFKGIHFSKTDRALPRKEVSGMEGGCQPICTVRLEGVSKGKTKGKSLHRERGGKKSLEGKKVGASFFCDLNRL